MGADGGDDGRERQVRSLFVQVKVEGEVEVEVEVRRNEKRREDVGNAGAR